MHSSQRMHSSTFASTISTLPPASAKMSTGQASSSFCGELGVAA